MTLQEAKDVLRLDDDEIYDPMVQALLNALPGYIEVTTGMSEEQQKEEPLVNTVSGFILHVWFDQATDEKLQRTIDHLLKCISLKVKK